MPVRLDLSYFFSIPAIIRLVQVVLGLLIIILIAVATNQPGGGPFVQTVCGMSMIASVILLGLYVFHIADSCMVSMWPLVKLIYTAIFTFLYFISMIICAVYAAQYKNKGNNSKGCFGAAAFFCVVCLVLYAIDSVAFYRNYKVGKANASARTGAAGSIEETSYVKTTTTVKSQHVY